MRFSRGEIADFPVATAFFLCELRRGREWVAGAAGDRRSLAAGLAGAGRRAERRQAAAQGQGAARGVIEAAALRYPLPRTPSPRFFAVGVTVWC